MSDDYEIGYKKPPRRTQFKKGHCANPKGRGAGQGLRAGKIFEDFLQAPVEITEGKKRKIITRLEFLIRKWVAQALQGDIKSAELLLDQYYDSKKHGDYRHVPVGIRESDLAGNWLTAPPRSAQEAQAQFQRLINATPEELEELGFSVGEGPRQTVAQIVMESEGRKGS